MQEAFTKHLLCVSRPLGSAMSTHGPPSQGWVFKQKAP